MSTARELKLTKNYSHEFNLEICTTIALQMGGLERFCQALGIDKLYIIEVNNMVGFMLYLPSGDHKGKSLFILYNEGSDLYEMALCNYTDRRFIVEQYDDNVYCDYLIPTFEEMTGIYTGIDVHFG